MHLYMSHLGRWWRAAHLGSPSHAQLGQHKWRLAIASFVSGCVVCAGAPMADPWLDRVENNLRRIQAASKYTAPADVGSKAAGKVHRACTKKNDEEACTKIIWRAPELLPIRDWAVGTAHITRGEIREKRADVQGALADYQNAIEYQAFPNLRGRIKRLKLRLEHEKKAAQAAASEAAKRSKQTRISDTAQQAAAKTDAHPVVVIEGWQPEVGEQSANPQPVGAPSPRLTTAPLSEADTTTFSTQASSPEPEKSLRLAARYLPGRDVALAENSNTSGARADGGISEPTSKPAEALKPALQSVSEPGGAARLDQPNAAMRFPVADEIKTALSEVRRRTEAVLTTSALRGRPHDSPRAVVHQSTAVLAIVGYGLLFLTLFYFAHRGWLAYAARTLNVRAGSGHGLNVEDLKEIVQKRSDEKLAARKAVLASPLQALARNENTVLQNAEGTTKEEGTKRTNSDVDAAALRGSIADETANLEDHGAAAVPGPETAVHHDIERTVRQPGTNIEVAEPAAPANAGEDLADLVPRLVRVDDSTLRRVAERQASLIVIGGSPEYSGTLLQRFPEACQGEVAGRIKNVIDPAENVRGMLNPFWATPPGADPLAAKQQFNAGFETLCSVFDLIFGETFVRHTRVSLRHIVVLVQQQPEPSLSAMLNCLENRQTLSAYEDAIAKIDNVSARLFFTTTFASEAFATEASYMTTTLRAVLSSGLVANLCAPIAQPNGHISSLTDPRISVLPLCGIGLTRAQAGLLLSSLLQRFVLQSLFGHTGRASEFPTSLVLPPLEGFGQERASLDFLAEQVRRTGVTVL